MSDRPNAKIVVELTWMGWIVSRQGEGEWWRRCDTELAAIGEAIKASQKDDLPVEFHKREVTSNYFQQPGQILGGCKFVNIPPSESPVRVDVGVLTEGFRVWNAAMVIATTFHIREYLKEHDPKALEQLDGALRLSPEEIAKVKPIGPVESAERDYSHMADPEWPTEEED